MSECESVRLVVCVCVCTYRPIYSVQTHILECNSHCFIHEHQASLARVTCLITTQISSNRCQRHTIYEHISQIEGYNTLTHIYCNRPQHCTHSLPLPTRTKIFKKKIVFGFLFRLLLKLKHKITV